MKASKLKILLSILTISLLCSCNNNNISSENSFNSESISETPKPIVYKNNVSIGCPYTTSIKAHKDYIDVDNSQLTDGIYSQDFNTSYTNTSFVGFGAQNAFFLSVTIDLKQVYDTINSFELSALNYNLAGILPPINYQVHYSVDNITYKSIKVEEIKSNPVMETRLISTIDLDEQISARYITFEISKPGFFIFLDELSVFANEKPIDYEDEIKTQISKLYENDNTNYYENRNLFKGSSIDKSLGRLQINKDASYITNIESLNDKENKLLSDSLTNDDFKKGTYATYDVSNNNLDVTFTLNKKYDNIADFEASVYANYKLNNKMPLSMKISVSNDNNSFYDIGVVYGPTDPSLHSFVYKLHLNSAISAMYVKFSFTFENSNKFYIEECGIYAYDTIKSNIEKINYPKYDDNVLNGSKDIPIIYHNSYTKNSYEDILPYVGYIDESNNIKDFMFDGFLYCLTGVFPSGSLIPTSDDLNWNMNELLSENQNLSALNKACGDVNKALNSNKKYNVFVSLYLPYPITSFYYLNETEKEALIQKSIKELTDYIDEFEKRFAQCNFTNLTLAGYYWYSEAIAINEPVEIYNAVANKIHSLNESFMWIPYYYSDGYDRWQKYGFDVAYMQPNYAFVDNCDASRLLDCAKLATANNMSIELEMHWDIYSKEYYYQNYMDYLSYGITYGYMKDTIHTYYFNLAQIARLAYSNDRKLRYLYDSTYKFIKGTLSNEVSGVDNITYNCNFNNIYEDKITIQNENEVIYYKLDCSTTHGSLTLYSDGTFQYYPDKNYKGEDSFTYIISNYLGESISNTIIVNVN